MRYFLFLSCLLFATTVLGQGYEKDLSAAQKLYEAGDQESAKALYLKAAANGSAEAHFALAYQYTLTPQEAIYHYSEAAKTGHAKALEYALEKLLFRAASLRFANPQKALDLYEAAKKANPGLSLYEEEKTVALLKLCAEPKGFDAEQFIKKYGLEDSDGQGESYYVWELAEEASQGGRFGKPDPELVLNLVIRGGVVPAEFEAAVKKVHSDWKNSVVEKFDICDYVLSGSGQQYCAQRATEEEESNWEAQLRTLAEALGKSAPLLDTAFAAAVRFIETKAQIEEGHEGSGRGAWILESQNEQKNQYLALIDSIRLGFIPKPQHVLSQSDQRLNQTYQRVKQELVQKAKENYPVTPDGLKQVQRAWIPYRDASVDLFMAINPALDKNGITCWFTEKRIQDLENILQIEN
jgi:hypothetical protein